MPAPRGGARGGANRLNGGQQLPFEVDAALESEVANYHDANHDGDDDDDDDWTKELYPPTRMPVFHWRSAAERADAKAQRLARAASRRRLLRDARYAGTGFFGGGGGGGENDSGAAARKRGWAEFDAFAEADTYVNWGKRVKRGDEVWPLRGKGIEKSGLPKELWIAVSDGEESRRYAQVDLDKTAKRRARKRQAALDADEELDGKGRDGEAGDDDENRDDNEDGIEELKDDDFDEDEDDAGNDYNAEKYFDDGDGGDDDHGGDDGGDDY